MSSFTTLFSQKLVHLICSRQSQLERGESGLYRISRSSAENIRMSRRAKNSRQEKMQAHTNPARWAKDRNVLKRWAVVLRSAPERPHQGSLTGIVLRKCALRCRMAGWPRRDGRTAGQLEKDRQASCTCPRLIRYTLGLRLQFTRKAYSVLSPVSSELWAFRVFLSRKRPLSTTTKTIDNSLLFYSHYYIACTVYLCVSLLFLILK